MNEFTRKSEQGFQEFINFFYYYLNLLKFQNNVNLIHRNYNTNWVNTKQYINKFVTVT